MSKVTVFIADYAPADERSIRMGLMAKSIYPVFYEDMFAFADLVEGEDITERQNQFFENACKGIEAQGRLAIAKARLETLIGRQLVTYCKAKSLPVDVYDTDFNITNPWA